MRILIFDTCYGVFLDAFYGRAGLQDASYDEQWQALMGTRFGTSDAYSHNLAKAGVAAHEIVTNAEPLQLAWEREHGAPASVPEQVRWFDADVAYFQNLHDPSASDLAALRRAGVLVVGQIASAAPADDRLREFDLVLTSFPHYVERFRTLGVGSEYFRIGFDTRILDDLDAGPPSREIVFVGALNRLRHRRGNAIFDRAAREVPIEFYGYDLRGWAPWSRIRRGYRGQAWGLEMYRLLHGARISLNRHIAEAEGHANNMRLYEATGVGSLLLTDEGSNLAELFDPGSEVVTYADVDDLVEKARHYLAHEDERRAIAAAGQARTLREHTYELRMRELVEILERAR
ncbi:MAG TPA: glycosyltransferase [Gaiellaceae bacterium]|jgi:glycosyltransferase involved in cell wall biosynthesis